MKFIPHNYQAMCIDKVVHQNAVGLFFLGYGIRQNNYYIVGYRGIKG